VRGRSFDLDDTSRQRGPKNRLGQPGRDSAIENGKMLQVIKTGQKCGATLYGEKVISLIYVRPQMLRVCSLSTSPLALTTTSTCVENVREEGSTKERIIANIGRNGSGRCARVISTGWSAPSSGLAQRSMVAVAGRGRSPTHAVSAGWTGAAVRAAVA